MLTGLACQSGLEDFGTYCVGRETQHHSCMKLQTGTHLMQEKSYLAGARQHSGLQGLLD